jgi:hypothetical protein
MFDAAHQNCRLRRKNETRATLVKILLKLPLGFIFVCMPVMSVRTCLHVSVLTALAYCTANPGAAFVLLRQKRA